MDDRAQLRAGRRIASSRYRRNADRISGTEPKARIKREIPRTASIVSLGGHHHGTDTTSRTRRRCRARRRAVAAECARQGRRTAGRQAGAELLSLQGRRRPGDRHLRRRQQFRAARYVRAQREEGRSQRGARKGLHAEGQDVASSSRRWSSIPAASWSSSTPATARRLRVEQGQCRTVRRQHGRRRASIPRRSTWW